MPPRSRLFGGSRSVPLVGRARSPPVRRREGHTPLDSLVSWGLRASTIAAFESLGLDDCVLARVTSAPGGRWRVVTEQGDRLAERAGRLGFEAATAADLPAVGDWLAVRPRPGEDRVTVVAVVPRASALVRKAAGRAVAPQVLAANVDAVLVACAMDQDWNPSRLARYLAVAWESGARPVVVLTKADLAPDLEARVAEAESVAVGAAVVPVSARAGLGLDALPAHLASGETTVIVGSSGTGKSTLVNRLLGSDVQATSGVRAHDGRGLHTTTVREMFALPWGALLVDTPGLREIAVWTDGESVAAAFDDVVSLAAECRFRDCRHGPEPGCAVRAGVESGRLAADRLDDYLRLVREQAFLARKEDPLLARAERARWKAIGKAGREAWLRKRRGWAGP
jgi:ribosome biogenesis GTPase